jgi:hypothetical protein
MKRLSNFSIRNKKISKINKIFKNLISFLMNIIIILQLETKPTLRKCSVKKNKIYLRKKISNILIIFR